jgi:hypothetical protein
MLECRKLIRWHSRALKIKGVPVKNLFILSFSLYSLQSFAGLIERDWHTYVGSDDGAACEVSVAFNTKSVAAKGIVFGKTSVLNDQKLIIDGPADFYQAKATILLNAKGEASSLKLETKSPIKPFYTTTLNCTNLVRTK